MSETGAPSPSDQADDYGPFKNNYRSRARTEAEARRLHRFDDRRQNGQIPVSDFFDNGWMKFGLQSSHSSVEGCSYSASRHYESGTTYVNIQSSGHFEFVRTDKDPAPWIEDRAPRMVRRHSPLIPLSAIGGDCRVDRETHILAYVAQNPCELSEFTWMDTDVFTTHPRFELYDAMLTLRVRGTAITPEATLALLETRMLDIEPIMKWKRDAEMGGFSNYLSRLLVTPSDAMAALDAAERLVADDARSLVAHYNNKQSNIVQAPLVDATQLLAADNQMNPAQPLPEPSQTASTARSQPQVRP